MLFPFQNLVTLQIGSHPAYVPYTDVVVSLFTFCLKTFRHL